MRSSYFKSFLIFIFIIFFCNSVIAQKNVNKENNKDESNVANNLSALTIINTIGNKKKTTFGDAVQLFAMALDKDKGSFQELLTVLKSAGITRGLGFKKSDVLRKGTLALLTAQYCKLGDHLLYLIFKSERYAVRACIANNFMSTDSSEWDKVSGEELIEMISKIQQKKNSEDYKEPKNLNNLINNK